MNGKVMVMRGLTRLLMGLALCSAVGAWANPAERIALRQERRAEQQAARQERQAQRQEAVQQRRERMSPEERKQFRQSIHDAGKDVYGR